MLLVLTGSGDGTANLLFPRLGKDAFRFNFDIFDQYSVCLTPGYWSIENPAGLRIDSETASSAFWWKAFNFFTGKEEYVSEEVKYVFREIYGSFLDRGLIKGNPPDFHRYKGKLSILDTARKFFKIPETATGWGEALRQSGVAGKSAVAKSLSSGLITTDKALFTTEVDFSRLDFTYPWYLQEKIEALSDLTIFICGQRLFTFSRDRAGLVGLDWRNQGDIFSTDQKWIPFELSAAQALATREFIDSLGVEWGRIDLLWDGKELIFLEYNANGQFFFLDDRDQFGILDCVIDYLQR
jgi:hypothetical protein